MNWYNVSQLISGIFSLFIGIFVFTRNRRHVPYVTFAFSCLSVAIWCLCYFVWQLQKTEESALTWLRFMMLGAVFIHTFYLHFILSFTDLVRAKIKILLFSYSSSVVLGISIFTPFFMPKLGHQKLIFRYWPDATPLSTTALIIELFIVIYGLYILFRSIKATTGNKQIQLKYMFILFLVAWGGGLTSWFLWYDIAIPPFGNSLVTLYTAAIAYAILRHKLLDINLVFRKGIIYSLLATVITVVYFIAIFLLENLFRGFMGYQSTFLTLFIIVIFIILFQPLKNKIQFIVDKYFFKGSIDQIELENIRLREELQRSDKLRAVGTLAAGMAHEIKNPLTSIKTFTEYLPKKYQNKEFVDKFQRIVTSEVDKINSIVGRLLDFAKPKPLELKDYNIQKLIDETIELLSNDFIKYRIKVGRDYKISNPTLKIDPMQIEQAILNLILNAIDAMKEKGGQLIIKTNDGVKQNSVEIHIEDTGCGIDEKDLVHLFDPFYSTKDTNTGLGLSIVHGIIEKHSGRIEVESTPGKGTNFTIYLPGV